MKKPTAEAILNSYRTLVAERDGQPVGEAIFLRESGLTKYHWHGGHWRSWSAFQEAAGFSPNLPTPRTEDEVVLRAFAELALERGSIPTEADLSMRRKQDPEFPSKMVFRRWGGREALVRAATDYCEGKPEFGPVLEILTEGSSVRLGHRLDALRISGFVYLIRSGKNYKIGRTNAAGRRLHELAIQLPQKPDTVHVIETDDPEGIEQYWHRRFADKRQGGEWFALTGADVQAFKKRRFQ